MKRRLAIAAVLAAAIALGALREFLFLNLNYQLDHVRRATGFSYAHSIFQAWTHGWSLGQLNGLKWALSIGYVLVMTSLATVLAFLLFRRWSYSRPIVLAVGAVCGLALVLHLFSAWLPPLADVGVKLLHMVQYPVVMLVLVAGKALGAQSIR
ncbi:MAG: hypothetical protein WAU70_17090 [Flavobacteriales bacterium]